jgi:hypothetical protein
MHRTLAIGWAVGLVATVSLVAGCSSGSSNSSSGASKQDYVDAAMKTYDPSTLPVSKAQARCLVGGVIDVVGVDKLHSLGITPKELAQGDPFESLGKKLSTEEAGKLSDVMFGGKCVDPAVLLSQDLQGSLQQLSPTERTCFIDKLAKTPEFKQSVTNEMLGKSASSPFTSDPSAVTGIMQQCGISASQLQG